MNEDEQKDLVNEYVRMIIDDLAANKCDFGCAQDIINNIFHRLQVNLISFIESDPPITNEDMIEIYDITTTILCTDGRDAFIEEIKNIRHKN